MSTSNSKSAQGGNASVPPAPSGSAPASFAPAAAGTAPSIAGAVPVGGSAGGTTGSSTAGNQTTAVPTTADAGTAHQGFPRTDAPRPAARPEPIGPRRIRLSVSRVDPWSAMKMSFLLSIALGIMMVVASVVFWKVLDGMHVFTEVDSMVKEVLGEKTKVNILQYVELSRVVSLTTILAIVDVVLLTALGTIGAFLYNVVAALVGGIHLTLTDD